VELRLVCGISAGKKRRRQEKRKRRFLKGKRPLTKCHTIQPIEKVTEKDWTEGRLDAKGGGIILSNRLSLGVKEFHVGGERERN